MHACKAHTCSHSLTVKQADTRAQSLFLIYTHTDTHTHMHIHMSKYVYKERNEKEKERERKEKRGKDVERGGTPSFLVLVFILINVSMICSWVVYFPGTLLVLIPPYHWYHCMRIYGLEVKNSCPFACYSMLTPTVFVRS